MQKKRNVYTVLFLEGEEREYLRGADIVQLIILKLFLKEWVVECGRISISWGKASEVGL